MKNVKKVKGTSSFQQQMQDFENGIEVQKTRYKRATAATTI